MLATRVRPAAAGRSRAGSRRHCVAVSASLASQPLSRRDALLAGAASVAGLWIPGAARAADASSIYDFSAPQYGTQRSLADFKGKVVVVMNIASEWGLQKLNYPGLRTLYDKYKDQGFELIGFPCNQFGGQAPGTSQEEREWAWKKFGVEFDVFDHIDVNGAGAHPLYKFLKERQPMSGKPNGEIEWNYAKFLVDRNGQPVKRYKPSFDPLEMEGDLRLVLAGLPPLPSECTLHPGRRVCNVDGLLAAAGVPVPTAEE